MVGAILTQSTSWKNVERAITNLKRERLLSPTAMTRLSIRELAALVRPSGYFNQKARRLKNLLSFLARYRTLGRLFEESTHTLRKELLALNGLGPETTDSILLYAAERPVFVVDAYTRRILSRHGWIRPKATYEQIQDLFHAQLPSDVHLFNQYHALLVNVGKNFCKRNTPNCSQCPLEPMLPEGAPQP